jgi:hypothetical protein
VEWVSVVAKRAGFAAILLASIGVVCAGGVPPELHGKTLPAYDAPEGACYVLLKPQVPYYRSSDEEPVCRAVLENYNKFCESPPQYVERKIHPATTDLHEPQWTELPLNGNPDLLKRLILPGEKAPDQEVRWQGELPRLEPLIASGAVKLFRADIAGLDGTDSIHTVYRVENLDPRDGADNQAHFMFAEPGTRVRSPRFSRLIDYTGELIQHRNRWYISRFSTLDQRFLVLSIGSEPIMSLGVCAIEHEADRMNAR